MFPWVIQQPLSPPGPRPPHPGCPDGRHGTQPTTGTRTSFNRPGWFGDGLGTQNITVRWTSGPRPPTTWRWTSGPHPPTKGRWTSSGRPLTIWSWT